MSINEPQSSKNKLEIEFLKSLPHYERLWHEILKKLVDQVNCHSDFLLEKYYLNPGFFRRHYDYEEEEDSWPFEEIIQEQQMEEQIKKESQISEKFLHAQNHFLDHFKKREQL